MNNEEEVGYDKLKQLLTEEYSNEVNQGIDEDGNVIPLELLTQKSLQEAYSKITFAEMISLKNLSNQITMQKIPRSNNLAPFKGLNRKQRRALGK